MRVLFIVFFLFIAPYGQAQPVLVPAPATIKMHDGNFLWADSLPLFIKTDNFSKEAIYLAEMIKEQYGLHVLVFKGSAVNGMGPAIRGKAIELEQVSQANSRTGQYELTVTANRIYLASATREGIFSGIQTLLQLLPLKAQRPLTIPKLAITDYPRFAYRGMHLDVARHFFQVSFIKKYIDYLATYKFNTFHWHLTDDQGWRIEIKRYPKLTQVGGFRNGTIIGRYPGSGNDSIRYGGFYTQEEIKEVVRYAADRHITVIPEIEMPGHASAAIAAYPQLSCFPLQSTKILATTPWAGSRKGKQVQQTWGVFEDVFCPSEYTFKFLQNVVDEVLQLFPSNYIHIGGDECPKEAWKKSAFCQQLIKSKKLKDEHGLQSYFIQRMEKYINSKGKKIIGWDEILEGGLAPNATVMSWRGDQGGITAAQQQHDVVMTPGQYVYFDHTQSANEDSVTFGGFTPLEKVYEYEPVPGVLSAADARYVLGAQANLWTEYIKSPAKVEYSIFPRITALSEVLWSPKEKRNWNDYERKLPAIFQNLEERKITYSKAFYELKASVLPAENNEGLIWKLESKNNEPISVSANGSDSQWIYNGTHFVTKNIRTLSAKSNMVTLTQNFSFNKATGKKITLANEPSKSYPGDGAFTLVNGVQNQRGLSSSRELLGFSGKNLEAIIDLGAITAVNEIVLHCLEQTGSWIYRPVSVSFYTSINGNDYTLLEKKRTAAGDRFLAYKTQKKTQARFVKVIAQNQGVIATGLPGAGNPAWLFAHEIEVQ